MIQQIPIDEIKCLCKIYKVRWFFDKTLVGDERIKNKHIIRSPTVSTKAKLIRIIYKCYLILKNKAFIQYGFKNFAHT